MKCHDMDVWCDGANDSFHGFVRKDCPGPCCFKYSPTWFIHLDRQRDEAEANSTRAGAARAAFKRFCELNESEAKRMRAGEPRDFDGESSRDLGEA
jgi:hypothetical protein